MATEGFFGLDIHGAPVIPFFSVSKSNLKGGCVELKERQKERVAEIIEEVRRAAGQNGKRDSIRFKSAPSRRVRQAVLDQAREGSFRIAFNTNGRSMIVFSQTETPPR